MAEIKMATTYVGQRRVVSKEISEYELMRKTSYEKFITNVVIIGDPIKLKETKH